MWNLKKGTEKNGIGWCLPGAGGGVGGVAGRCRPKGTDFQLDDESVLET